MAQVTTTLSTACGLTDRQIVVTSATSFVAKQYVLVDDEVMQIGGDYVSGTAIPVLRGRENTVQAAHAVKANVTTGLATDWQNPPAGGLADAYFRIRPVAITSVGSTPATLTLPPPGSDLRVILSGTAAITLTIPVPTKDMDGTEISFVSNGAAAHLLTFTGGLSGAGSSYDVVTINATAPAAFKVVAANALWMCYCGPAMGGTVTNLIGSVA